MPDSILPQSLCLYPHPKGLWSPACCSWGWCCHHSCSGSSGAPWWPGDWSQFEQVVVSGLGLRKEGCGLVEGKPGAGVKSGLEEEIHWSLGLPPEQFAGCLQNCPWPGWTHSGMGAKRMGDTKVLPGELFSPWNPVMKKKCKRQTRWC